MRAGAVLLIQSRFQLREALLKALNLRVALLDHLVQLLDRGGGINRDRPGVDLQDLAAVGKPLATALDVATSRMG